MTELLRMLANLLPAGPWVVFGDYYEQGPIYNGWDPELEDHDEACDCDDGPPGYVVYQLPAPYLRDLFEEVAHARANGAADHGMAALMLRSIESQGDAA